MGKEFFIDTTIGYFGTNHNLCLTPQSLLLYFQDLAISHSNDVGYTLSWLGERKRGWAITNYHIVVNRYPSYGETIRITTWSNNCRRMQAQRSFDVVDSFGKTICRAMSRWIYMDLEKRRPSPLDENMEERYCCNRKEAIEGEKYNMPKVSDDTLFSERSFIVTRSSTDTNGHVNNTKYVEWAMDDVPDDIYNRFSPVDIKVVYRKECYKDTNVISRCYVEKLQCGTQVTSHFFAECDNSLLSEVSTIWI